LLEHVGAGGPPPRELGVAREEHERALDALGHRHGRVFPGCEDGQVELHRVAEVRRTARRDDRHEKTTGARLMPAMTNDAACSTSRADSSTENRSSSAASMAEISMRASAAPRQKCGPNPSATSWLGSRPTSNSAAVGPNSSSSRLADA